MPNRVIIWAPHEKGSVKKRKTPQLNFLHMIRIFIQIISTLGMSLFICGCDITSHMNHCQNSFIYLIHCPQVKINSVSYITTSIMYFINKKLFWMAEKYLYFWCNSMFCLFITEILPFIFFSKIWGEGSYF